MFCRKKFLRTVITEIFTEFYFCGLTNFCATGNKRKLAKFYWDKRLMLQLSWMRLLEHLKKMQVQVKVLKVEKLLIIFCGNIFCGTFFCGNFFAIWPKIYEN